MRIKASFTAAVNPRCAVGGATVRGHFGELVQGRFWPGGPLVLVTLPGPFAARAVFCASRGPLLIPPGRGKARDAARRVLWPGLGGVLSLAGGAPPGGGAGSSTMDVLATIRAIRAAGAAGALDSEAALCLAVEAASDPLMLPDPGRVLWASRAARVVEVLPPPPPMVAVGGFDGPGMVTPAGADGFADASDWIAVLREGFARRDLHRTGAAVMASAQANQAFNPKPHWADLTLLARHTGAAGIAVAHTGSAAALLFPPGANRAEEALAGLREIGLTAVCRFTP